ncbi:hypothetical protein B0H14DRAFT_2696988 [Mycena olivaceomarginata]|nr:hypothetical protein B0H14DRAFT_2696988 [Mycena olivaceomarginata]
MRCAAGGASGDTCATLPLLLSLPLSLLFPLLHPAPHARVRRCRWRGQFACRARSKMLGAWRAGAGCKEADEHVRERDGGKKDGSGSGQGCGRGIREGRTRAPKMQRCARFRILNPLLLLPPPPSPPPPPPPRWTAAQPVHAL